MQRNGKTLAVPVKGHPRRLSDFRNAWRKMTPDQRKEAVEWMRAENLEVAK